MTKKLPTGWVETKLGEVTLPVATVRPEATPDVEFTYFDIGGIDNQHAKIATTQSVAGREAPSRARQSVKMGDILFSTVRTYLKNIALVEDEHPNPVASTGFTVIRPGPGVIPKFLFHQVLTESFLQPLHDLQTGTSYPAVRDRDVFAQTVRLAPTAEQARSVAKLDDLFARLDAGEAALRRAKERLKRYRVAVLHAAVTGELTKAWRKEHQSEETGAELLKRLLIERRKKWEAAELAKMHEKGKEPRDGNWKSRYLEPTLPDTTGLPGLPKGWVWASIDAIVTEPVRNGISVKGSVQPTGVTALRLDAMTDSGFDYSKVRHLPLPADAVADLWVRDGDFFVSRGNGSLRLVGRGTIASNAPGHLVYPDTMIRLRLAAMQSLSAWVSTIWGSNLIRRQVESRAKTTAGIYKISHGDLRVMAIPLPPLVAQGKIVREVKSRLASADHLAAAIDEQLAGARRQRQAILRDAFAGRLVARDEHDEPAAALLDRVRAECRPAERDSLADKRSRNRNAKCVSNVAMDGRSV